MQRRVALSGTNPFLDCASLKSTFYWRSEGTCILSRHLYCLWYWALIGTDGAPHSRGPYITEAPHWCKGICFFDSNVLL